MLSEFHSTCSSFSCLPRRVSTFVFNLPIFHQGTYVPTPPPTPPAYSSTDSGCPGAYVAGTDYAAAAKVSVQGATHTEVYECAAAPNNLFCGKSGYEPGTGQYWETVWTALGSCSGTISPTASPNFSTLTDAGGCPDVWEAGVNKYEENDKVSKNGLVFQCAAFPYSGFCGQVGYEPMPDDGTEFWKDAWTVVGYCSGTISVSSFHEISSASPRCECLISFLLPSQLVLRPSIPTIMSVAALTSGRPEPTLPTRRATWSQSLSPRVLRRRSPSHARPGPSAASAASTLPTRAFPMTSRAGL